MTPIIAAGRACGPCLLIGEDSHYQQGVESFLSTDHYRIEENHAVRIKLRLAQECEDTLWGLASHLEDAAFLVAFGLLIIGTFLLLSWTG